MIFADRREAGRQLATMLTASPGALVLGIPRGGVIVAAEVATAIGGRLDVVVPRKLGAPANPELGIGAVAEDGTTVLDERLVRLLGVSEEYLIREVALQISEIHRRVALYRRGREPLQVAGSRCIVVDDGIATGGTAEVAVRSLKRRAAEAVVLAVPVAPAESLERLAGLADEVVCLATPEPFSSVGQWYVRFPQVSDEEVLAVLERS